MKRIVAGITSLEQHLQTMRESPEVYRPAACPHCGIKIVWVHGLYHRKADLCHRGEASLNPVPILRYCCSACRRTCSRLPECIAPRRWYNWFLQQIGLRAVLDPTQAAAAPGGPTPALRTWRSDAGPAHTTALAAVARGTRRGLPLLPGQPLSRVGACWRGHRILARRLRDTRAVRCHGLARRGNGCPMMA